MNVTNSSKLSTPLNNQVDKNNNASAADRKNDTEKRHSDTNLSSIKENRDAALDGGRQTGTISMHGRGRHCDLDDFLGLGVALTSTTCWPAPPSTSCTVDSRLCVKLIDVGEDVSPVKSKSSKSRNPLLFRAAKTNSKASQSGWWRFYDQEKIASLSTISKNRYDDIVQLCLSITEPIKSSNTKSNTNAKISQASSSKPSVVSDTVGKEDVKNLTSFEGLNAAYTDNTNQEISNNNAISTATKTVSSRLRCMSVSKIEQEKSSSPSTVEKSEQKNSLKRSETSIRSPMPNNGRGDEDDNVFCKFCRKNVEFFEYYLGKHESVCQTRISGGAIPKTVGGSTTFNKNVGGASAATTTNKNFDFDDSTTSNNFQNKRWDRGDDTEDKAYEGQRRGRPASRNTKRSRCLYCNVSIPVDFLTWHQRECTKNPDVIEQRDLARREEFEQNLALWRSTPNPPPADWGYGSSDARRREREQERHLEATVGKSRDIHAGDSGKNVVASGEFDYNQSYVDASMSTVMLPCEYCQESYPGEIFLEHEKICQQNQQQQQQSQRNNKAWSAANA